ncbi:NAD(P)-dependent oxidoreductase [Flavobacterium cerinum]|uniref:NAD(P)H-binding protein n=1 Tax=Flavobacterium cerinum TaxID=2502784 RepID=A0ABY5ITW0_9FLAO|nr:NAD(P)H-binding protein [Flavobacterium cerinum]UUC45183.1 NAD(P)H-binding protein [Flavobacterium cerinum]
MKTIKIAVIGGTGKSGKYLVQQLLQKGYSIRLLLRNPEHFEIKSPLIEIVKGDARDYESVFLALQNCDCVLSMLGQPKGESSIFSTATSHIIKAMQQLGLPRYIVTTGLNVNTEIDSKSEKVQIATNWMYEHYPETTNDKQKEYEILSKSELNWTMVRLPLIRQTNDSFPYQTSLTDCSGDFISATDLADFVIREMQEGHFIKKAPFLYNF